MASIRGAWTADGRRSRFTLSARSIRAFSAAATLAPRTSSAAFARRSVRLVRVMFFWLAVRIAPDWNPLSDMSRPRSAPRSMTRDLSARTFSMGTRLFQYLHSTIQSRCARNGATGGDIDRMNRTVSLYEPGVDFGGEAKFAQEPRGLMLVLLPAFHQADSTSCR